jgi:hypothetical protein
LGHHFGDVANGFINVMSNPLVDSDGKGIEHFLLAQRCTSFPFHGSNQAVTEEVSVTVVVTGWLVGIGHAEHGEERKVGLAVDGLRAILPIKAFLVSRLTAVGIDDGVSTDVSHHLLNLLEFAHEGVRERENFKL